jgi:hypothetical protein
MAQPRRPAPYRGATNPNSAYADSEAPASRLLTTLLILRTASTLMVGGAIVLGLILALGTLRSGSKFWAGIADLISPPPQKPEVDVRAVVVQQVRQVSELTSAIFTMEAVVPTRQERSLGSLPLGATTLLYIAHGEVRAGIDLSQLTAADVTVNDAGIQLRLPPPRILDAKIDVAKSKVYDYDRGFLGLGPDVGLELQSLASQTALNKIVETACSQDLLKQANLRAEVALTQLLSTAGHKTVLVQAQQPIGCLLPSTLSPAPVPGSLPPQVVVPMPGVAPGVAPGATGTIAPVPAVTP